MGITYRIFLSQTILVRWIGGTTIGIDRRVPDLESGTNEPTALLPWTHNQSPAEVRGDQGRSGDPACALAQRAATNSASDSRFR